MKISENQERLIHNLISQAKDNSPRECESSLKKLLDEAHDTATRLPFSGIASSKKKEYHIECAKLFINKCKSIYLDVLAPNEQPFDEELLNYIIGRINELLHSRSKTVKQYLEGSMPAFKEFKEEIDTDFMAMGSNAKRDLLIERDRRDNLQDKKTLPQSNQNDRIIPSFNFIKIKVLIPILQRDYCEISKCMEVSCWKAAIILSISAIEGILYDLLKQNEDQALKSKQAQKDKDGKSVLPLEDWYLSYLINVAFDLGFVTEGFKQLSHTIKEFRNLVHPMNEIKGSYTIGEHEADVAFSVLKMLLRENGDMKSKQKDEGKSAGSI